ncbi:ABC transporter permease [Actinoplanes subtropicus]|uniref:ABC transporter permease n=1 Tax=Actinoplanes subtropicus TaxID=543632 RepID=UPI0004C2DEFF|nr:ABC transporter permease [Actinoplanes subtropicus]
MRAALRAEWTKLRTVPDAAVALPLIALLTVAVSVAASTASSADVVRSSLMGVELGQAAVAVWGVQILAGEYGSGLITATFTALPRRLGVLAAKAVCLLAGILAVGVPSIVISVLAGHRLASAYPALSSGAVLRAGFGAVAYLCLIGLVGLGIGALVRSAVAGAGVVLGLQLAPTVMMPLLDPHWARWVYRLSPSTAGQAIQSTVDLKGLPIGPWPGLGVAAAWAFVLLTLGAFTLRTRDV